LTSPAAGSVAPLAGQAQAQLLTRALPDTEIRLSVMLWGSVMEEFYGSFAQRARELAEKADPFTRRRLLGLAKKYDAKSRPSGSARPLPTAGTTPPAMLFSGTGEA
jgi:hypothetical protein